MSVDSLLKIRSCEDNMQTYEQPINLKIVLSGEYSLISLYLVLKHCTLLFWGLHNTSLYFAAVLSLKGVNRMPKVEAFSCDCYPSKIRTN